MKFIHLSDLHIGKRVNEFSMIEDQKYIFIKILNIIDQEKPDAILICGDIYDKSVPSAEAVTLFDDFLVSLAKKNLKVFCISGNHDSPERIAFASKIMETAQIYMSPVYSKNILPINLSDDFGSINIYMLPFIKPAHVRVHFPDEKIDSYEDAVDVAIKSMNINIDERNILLTHQFVTGAQRSESEEISVGGTDNVSATVFANFDYVALGHIHKPQNIKENIRYCGTPLKYSFSEANHNKSVTVVEILEKNTPPKISTIDLIPQKDMIEIKGTYMDIMDKSYYTSLNLDDYYHITLTDEEDIPDAISKLRVIYKNIMKLDYDNKRTQRGIIITSNSDIENKSPLSIISDFYQLQNNQEINEEQEKYLLNIIEDIWEGRKWDLKN